MPEQPESQQSQKPYQSPQLPNFLGSESDNLEASQENEHVAHDLHSEQQPLSCRENIQAIESKRDLDETEKAIPELISNLNEQTLVAQSIEDAFKVLEFQPLEDAKDKLKEDSKWLVRQNTTLVSENARLQLDLATKDAIISELEVRCNELMGTLTEFTRDKSTTYVSDDRPQNHLLVHEFIQLKDQEFQYVSTLLLHWLHELGAVSRLEQNIDRKEEIARIKSILSQKILLERKREEQISDSDLFSMQIDRILRTVFNTIQPRVIQLNLDRDTMPENLYQSLASLLQKGDILVDKILAADPPGYLWIEGKGTQFNANNHQPLLGCRALGTISFTVYPGYRVSDRIFEKACVFTEREEGL